MDVEHISITSPKALGEVLTIRPYDFVKPSQFLNMDKLLTDGIVLAEGDEHRKHGNNLSPAHPSRHINDIHPIFWDKSRDAVLAMTTYFNTKKPKDNSHATLYTDDYTTIIKVREWSSRATLDLIEITAFGQDLNTIQGLNVDLSAAYRKYINNLDNGVYLDA